MILIERHNTNPYFNIAAEEYFLKKFDEECIMIWVSEPSVVVGKHQNTMAEVNIGFSSKNNIPVIRRITGGGTVYHDSGNINYSIITKSENREKLVDFHKFTEPLIRFLNTMGVEAIFEGKNNLTIAGRKISGNSAHVYKNRVLHHGTILFNTRLDNLERSITPGSFSISDKAVKSIRANVCNLTDVINPKISLSDFIEDMTAYFTEYFNIETIYEIRPNDKAGINNLVETKYKQWEWNYGYSPTFRLDNMVDNVKLQMNVSKGVINSLDIDGKIDKKEKVCSLLINSDYRIETIERELNKLEISENDISLYIRLFGYYKQ